MHPLKSVGWFFLLAVGIYVLLVLPWPGVREAYRSLYLWTGRALFQTYGYAGLINFEPLSGDPDKDAKLTLGKRGVNVGQGMAIHTGRLGYAPTAALVALVLATPIRWSRKWKALIWGLILVNLFVILRLWLALLFSYCRPSPYQLYDPSPFWAKLVSGCHDFFFHAPTCSFLLPAFIWVLVSLRTEDFVRITKTLRNLKGDAKAG
jgi:ABC-type sugar transport system permease subunit